MTVSSTNRFNSFIPNGVVLVFAFTFRCDDAAWLSVLIDNVAVGGYTVLLNTDQETQPGGSVTFAVAPVGGLLVVQRDTDLLQSTVYQPYGRFPADSHEAALDKLTMEVQDLAEIASRTVPYPIGSNPALRVDEFPLYQAGKFWKWSATLAGVVENADALNQTQGDARYSKLGHMHPSADILNKNTAFNIPTLDGNGKIQAGQMPFTAFAFIGNLDASVGVLPPAPADGDMYHISIAGTLTVVPLTGSVPVPTALQPGDLIAYSDTSGFWFQIATNPAADASYVNASGDTMTGPLLVPAGGAGAQVLQAQEVTALIAPVQNQLTAVDAQADATDARIVGISATNIIKDGMIQSLQPAQTSWGSAGILSTASSGGEAHIGFYLPEVGVAASFKLNSNSVMQVVDAGGVAPRQFQASVFINGAGGDIASIGIGQTWQNLTASRLINTLYTNDTGRPITVCIDGILLNMGTAEFYIDSAAQGRVTTDATSVGDSFSFSRTIPNGSTYNFNLGGGGSSVRNWSELR